MLTPKAGRFGRNCLDRPTNPVRPPWSKSSKGNFDFPIGYLLLSRLRFIYIERPIWSLDEGDMAS
jgi:hypothetical protein